MSHRAAGAYPRTRLRLGEVFEAMARPRDAQVAYRSCHELARGSLLGERCGTRGDALR